jgi:type I restriction enzyme M protein
LDADTPG